MPHTIHIDSYIGYPITADYVREQLAATDGQPVRVIVSSLGGDLDTALRIRQQFIDHGQVTIYYTGFSASAATILATGAKHITMSRHALILCHQCLGYSETWGYFNRDQLAQAIADLKKQQTDLDTIDRVVASIYADRTSGKTDPGQMAALMAQERWLTADEALEIGLIDAIVDDKQSPAPQSLTATARAHFAACGLPLPYGDDASQRRNQETETSPRWLATLIQSLRDLLHPQPTNTTNTNTNMERTTITAPHISAALQAESIQATDGKVTLTTEQLATIEATIQSLHEAQAKAEAERDQAIKAQSEAQAKAEAALEAQAKAEAALAAADGDTTNQATPTATEDTHLQAGIQAADFFARFGASM